MYFSGQVEEVNCITFLMQYVELGDILNVCKKVKQTLYSPWRFQEFEAPRFKDAWKW